jgi:hypothetical protein
MLGTVEKQQEGGGRFSARFFLLQDGWMIYYDDATGHFNADSRHFNADSRHSNADYSTVLDKAREESFEVTAEIYYRNLPHRCSALLTPTPTALQESSRSGRNPPPEDVSPKLQDPHGVQGGGSGREHVCQDGSRVCSPAM